MDISYLAPHFSSEAWSNVRRKWEACRRWVPGLVAALAVLMTITNVYADAGDSKDEAISLGTLNQELVSTTGDVSTARPEIYYRFEIVGKTREVIVGIAGGTGAVNLYLQRDTDGNGVLEIVTGGRVGAASTALTKVWLDPGIYFVLVQRDSVTSFELRVSSIAKESRGEKDNDQATAMDLGEAREPLSFRDWVGVPDTEDWYKFTVKDGVREVAVGVFEGQGSLDVLLGRDSDGDGVLEGLTSGRIPASSGALPKLWLDPGTYFVQIAANSWTEYQIKVTSTAKESRGEKDNDPETAVDLGEAREPLSFRDWVGVSDTEDWYRFTVKDGVREVAVGVFEGQGSLDVLLGRDSDGDGVLEGLASGRLPANSGALPKLWLDPGTYFVQIAANSWTEYRLNVLSTGKESRGEEDNLISTAIDLGRIKKVAQYIDWVGTSDAIDYFRFEVRHVRREVSVTLSEGIGTVYLDLQQDANRDGIAEVLKSEIVDSASGGLGRMELDPGVYYVRVEIRNMTPYRLSINSTLLPGTSPFIDIHPASQTIIEGRNVVLSVDAEGSGTLSYQWYLNGQPLEGQNQPELRIPNVTSSAGGNYTVKVTSSFGEILSAPGELIVTPAGFALDIDAAVILSWPVSAGPVVLEASDTPEVPASWKAIPFQSITVGDRREVATRTLGAMKAYRLRKAEAGDPGAN